MSKSQLIKFSGWAFILGAFAFITILEGSDPVAIPGSLISAVLLAVGMLGLRARYGENAGGFGRNIALISVIATVLFYMSIATMWLLYISGIVPGEELAEEGGWIGLFGGPAVVLLGLTLFGLAALRRKPMPRLNWLPVIAGFWYPVAYLVFAGYLFTHHGAYQWDTTIRITGIIVCIQFFALCALGAFLVTDTSEQMATA
jgi:hypothetical protein